MESRCGKKKRKKEDNSQWPSGISRKSYMKQKASQVIILQPKFTSVPSNN